MRKALLVTILILLVTLINQVLFLRNRNALALSLSNSLTKSINEQIKLSSIILSKNEKSAYKYDFLKFLNNVDKNTLYSSSFTHGYKGDILTIDTATHIATESGFTYNFLISIKNESGLKKQFAYNEAGIKKIKVFLRKNIEKDDVMGKLSDLKTGDTIVIQETFNPMISCASDECLQEIKIIKIIQ